MKYQVEVKRDGQPYFSTQPEETTLYNASVLFHDLKRIFCHRQGYFVVLYEWSGPNVVADSSRVLEAKLAKNLSE